MNNAIDPSTFLAYEMPTCCGPQVTMAFCPICILYLRASFYDFWQFVFQTSELSTAVMSKWHCWYLGPSRNSMIISMNEIKSGVLKALSVNMLAVFTR